MTTKDASHRYPRSAWLIFVVVAVLAVFGGRVIADTTRHTSPSAGDSGVVTTVSTGNLSAVVKSPKALKVSGSQPTGLAPGITKPVRIRIKNPNNVRVQILRARVIVSDATESCRAKPNIRTTRYNVKTAGDHIYFAPKHGVVKIPLTITMRDRQDTGSKALGTFRSGNQDVCKRVRFPLTYKAVGRQV